MRQFMMNIPFMLALTIGAYLLGVLVKRKSGLALMHPFIISVPVVVAVLKFADIPCAFYLESTEFIDFLLGPCVVSLGFLLYDKREIIMKNLVGILSAITVGSVVGVASVWLLCVLLGLDGIFLYSLEPKSVTTPIGMDISASVGGNPSLTAVSVIFSGFIGAVIGPVVVKLFRSAVARGLAFGTSSHGLGTARAIEMGAVEGAVSGISIALMGLMTALVVPLFNMIMGL